MVGEMDQKPIQFPLRASVEEYSNWLKKQGIQELDRGSFGSVFQHPKDRDVVVKLVSRDDAYMSYVHLCHDNPSNRWLPTVLDVDYIVLKNGSAVNLVFLQRLDPASDRDVVKAFTEIAPWAEQNRFSLRCRLSFPEWKNAVRMATDPDTKKLVQFLTQHFNRLDLWTRNFMLRGSQVVFNDPLTPVE